MNTEKIRAKFTGIFLSEVFEKPQKFVCTERTKYENVSNVLYRFFKARYGIEWPSSADFKDAITLCGIESKNGVDGGYGLNDDDRSKLFLFPDKYLKVSAKDVWALSVFSKPKSIRFITNPGKLKKLYEVKQLIEAFERKNKGLFDQFYHHFDFES